jgi:integrase
MITLRDALKKYLELRRSLGFQLRGVDRALRNFVGFAEREGVPYITRDLALGWAQETATQGCPSLKRKTVTPHVLRHTAAMELLLCGIDPTVIALWLGHESVETTQMYLHADLRLKEQALSRTAPVDAKSGRYRPDDTLLAFLEGL